MRKGALREQKGEGGGRGHVHRENTNGCCYLAIHHGKESTCKLPRNGKQWSLAQKLQLLIVSTVLLHNTRTNISGSAWGHSQVLYDTTFISTIPSKVRNEPRSTVRACPNALPVYEVCYIVLPYPALPSPAPPSLTHLFVEEGDGLRSVVFPSTTPPPILRSVAAAVVTLAHCLSRMGRSHVWRRARGVVRCHVV